MLIPKKNITKKSRTDKNERVFELLILHIITIALRVSSDSCSFCKSSLALRVYFSGLLERAVVCCCACKRRDTYDRIRNCIPIIWYLFLKRKAFQFRSKSRGDMIC